MSRENSSTSRETEDDRTMDKNENVQGDVIVKKDSVILRPKKGNFLGNIPTVQSG